MTSYQVVKEPVGEDDEAEYDHFPVLYRNGGRTDVDNGRLVHKECRVIRFVRLPRELDRGIGVLGLDIDDRDAVPRLGGETIVAGPLTSTVHPAGATNALPAVVVSGVSCASGGGAGSGVGSTGATGSGVVRARGPDDEQPTTTARTRV